MKSPTNLFITADIQGADDDNPFGDGSGYVTFTAIADDAISYKFKILGEEFLASGGIKKDDLKKFRKTLERH